MPFPRPASLLLALAAALLAGCQALAEVAYDTAAENQTSQCRALVSSAEQSACLAKVREAQRQAERLRKKE